MIENITFTAHEHKTSLSHLSDALVNSSKGEWVLCFKRIPGSHKSNMF